MKSPSLRVFFLSIFGLAGLILGSGCASQDRPISRNLQQRNLPIERSQVQFETNFGTIVVRLYHNEAPETVRNFRQYVQDGHYDNTIFHRVVKDFVVQGGGYIRGESESGLIEKQTRDSIRNEANNGLRNRKGTIAMARTTEKDSARAQFFFNVSDNEVLDHGVQTFGYCVFGEVVQGMDIIERMANVTVVSTPRFTHLPREDVVLISARTLKVDEFVRPEQRATAEETQEEEKEDGKFLGIF